MTKRKSKLELQKFTVTVERRHWDRAKRVCVRSVGNRAVNGETVKSVGLSSNCVIADAIIEFFGDELPVRTAQGWDSKAMKYVDYKMVDLGVSDSTANIGKNRYRHNGNQLVKWFDGGQMPSKIKDLTFPVKVTFTRYGA